jgi:hypothetical protein
MREAQAPTPPDEEASFRKVSGRNTADYLLRTAQQHHAEISSMADTKANILITVSSIVLTLSLGRLAGPEAPSSLLALTAFTLLSLILAILAILPRFPRLQGVEGALPAGFNILFFGHFARLSRQRFREEMAHILEEDERVYSTLVDDLYSLGSYLFARKYRYLRWSYLALLTGFGAAAVIQVASLL